MDNNDTESGNKDMQHTRIWIFPLTETFYQMRRESFENGYFLPGCYKIPTLPSKINSYECTKPCQYTMHWRPTTEATYVADKEGIVHYASDFDYQVKLVLPWLNPSLLAAEKIEPIE